MATFADVTNPARVTTIDYGGYSVISTDVVELRMDTFRLALHLIQLDKAAGLYSPDSVVVMSYDDIWEFFESAPIAEFKDGVASFVDHKYDGHLHQTVTPDKISAFMDACETAFRVTIDMKYAGITGLPDDMWIRLMKNKDRRVDPVAFTTRADGSPLRLA